MSKVCTRVENILTLCLGLVLVFLVAPAKAETIEEKRAKWTKICEVRKRAFTKDFRFEKKNGEVEIFYKTPNFLDVIAQDNSDPSLLRLVEHSCKSYPVNCKDGVTINVSQTLQQVRVFEGRGQDEPASYPSAISGGRCTYIIKNLDVLDPKRKLSFARTTNGDVKVSSKDIEPFHCSGPYEGSGMPFSIPIVGDGEYIHGLDGNMSKAMHLGMPASAACVRAHDDEACRLYATVLKCGKVNVSVNGKFGGPKIIESDRQVNTVDCDDKAAKKDDYLAKDASRHRSIGHNEMAKKEKARREGATPAGEVEQAQR